MDKEQLDKMSKNSGESSVMGAPRWTLPIVRINGDTGEFLKIYKDKEGNKKTDVLASKDGTIEVITLKFRRTLNQFTDTESFFSTEHDTFNDRITIFSSKDGKIMPINEGIAKELREKNQLLKMTQVIYALLGKELVKLQVKGSSLTNFYEFRPEVKKTNKHLFQFLLEIGAEEVKGKRGSYYRMTFKMKEEIDDKKLKEVDEKMTEINEKLEEIDSFYQSRPSEKEQGELIAKEMKEKMMEEETPNPHREEEEEEIDVGKIPF